MGKFTIIMPSPPTGNFLEYIELFAAQGVRYLADLCLAAFRAEVVCGRMPLIR